MFFQGSLQEGISAAVEQQRMVLCFVTNDNEESRRWESDFLQEGPLGGLIRDQAVALRLEAGSESAGYLAQIFPLPQTPTVVVMKHGELKEYIAAGTTKDDFVRRLQGVFDAPPAPAAPASTTSTTSTTTQLPTTPAAGPAPATAQAPDSSPSPSSAATSAEPDARPDSVRRTLAERAARLQAKKEEAENRAKDERAKAKAKAAAEAEAGADTEAARSHRQAELLRRKRQQEDEERRRILKRIEDDRAERRQRAAQRQQARADGLGTGDVAAALASAPESRLPSMTRLGDTAAVQVRLFDGSTMRSRFRTAAPFRDVRGWVDEARTDGAVPYTFRQLLTPRPNTAIDETDEARTLGELGLAPSATLILVPVRNLATAYDARPRHLLSRIVAAVWALLASLIGLLGLGRGAGAAATTDAGGSGESAAAAQARHRRIKGFENADDRRRDQQLYNGNSLNFEPRPDDEDDDV